jgi:type VI secretion system Hcp family effector
MRLERIALLSVAVLCLVPFCSAQGHDTVFMNVNGISCNSPGAGAGDGMKITSWQMGVEQATGTQGGEAGKATFQPLVVTRPFDECSPLLLPAVFTGKNFSTVTLTQYGASHDGTPGAALMVVTLTTAAISSYAIGGDASHDPAETWTFKAEKICVKNVANNAQACWDFLTNNNQ